MSAVMFPGLCPTDQIASVESGIKQVGNIRQSYKQDDDGRYMSERQFHVRPPCTGFEFAAKDELRSNPAQLRANELRRESAFSPCISNSVARIRAS
jgi:hypothetical protein